MIELATRKNNHILNFQGKTGNAQQLSGLAGFGTKYPKAQKRTQNSDVYNCHGLVFGSRRTIISDSQEIVKILLEDDYTQISRENVLPGDIIVYFDSGDAEHSGVVVASGTSPFFVHQIVSKWGQLEEYIHPANQCPYNFSDVRYYRVTK